MISQTLRDIVRCPSHPREGLLLAVTDGLRCQHCGAVYPVVDGILNTVAGRLASGSSCAREARQWDSHAPVYDSKRLRDPIYMAAVRAAVARLGVRSGDRVLDAGCGTGLTVRQYQRPGVYTVGFDLSLDSLRYLKRQLPPGSPVDLVCGDLSALPFAPGVFSKVLCANTLQHLPEAALRERSTRELARVARPQARIVVTAHNYSRPKKRAGWPKEGAAGSHSGPVRYIYRFEAAEFEGMLARSMRVRHVAGAGLPLLYCFKLSPLMHGIEWLFSRSRLSTHWGNMLIGVGTRH